MKLSQEDQDLLRWSGELDGAPPAPLRAELDSLANDIRRLPKSPTPSGALSAALARHAHPSRPSRPSRRPLIRLGFYATAAALVVFAIASFLLQFPITVPEAASPTPADLKPAAYTLPARAFPQSESSNLKRIREARARLKRIKERRKPKLAPDESYLPRMYPTIIAGASHSQSTNT